MLNGYNRLVDKEADIEEEVMYNILDSKERAVFEILYDHPEYTHKKIGEILGHSGSYIARLEIRVKKRFKLIY